MTFRWLVWLTNWAMNCGDDKIAAALAEQFEGVS